MSHEYAFEEEEGYVPEMLPEDENREVPSDHPIDQVPDPGIVPDKFPNVYEDGGLYPPDDSPRDEPDIQDPRPPSPSLPEGFDPPGFPVDYDSEDVGTQDGEED